MARKFKVGHLVNFSLRKNCILNHATLVTESLKSSNHETYPKM